MNKRQNGQEHPEITDLKNICDVAPDAKNTQNVCNKIVSTSKKTTSGKKERK